jgi:hypothetical protein
LPEPRLPQTKPNMKATAAILLLVFLYIMITVATGCKTRKTQTDISSVKKSSSTEQQTFYRVVDTAKTIDTSAKVTRSVTNQQNTSASDTEFQADSAVTITKPDGTTKTKFYIKGTVKTHHQSTGAKSVDKTVKSKAGLSKTIFHSIDSVGSKSQKINLDSTAKHKVTEAKGSGTTWATWVPVVGGVVLIVALILFFIYKNKP